MKRNQLPTPALVLDLERFNNALEYMASLAARAGKKLRPHAKTHKSSEITKRQLKAGNCAGICAAKLGEAEALLKAGIENVLLTSPVVARPRIQRLAELKYAHPGLWITVDNVENLHALNACGIPFDLLADVNPNMGRTGVEFKDVPEFVKEILKCSNLRFHGIQCYAGNLQHVTNAAERSAATVEVMRTAASLVRDLRKDGIPCDILTGTGTGTAAFDVEIPELTDIQVGSYCMMDHEYYAIEGVGEAFPCALSCLSTVVSTNQSEFVTIDAGLKALYFTPHAPPCKGSSGLPVPNWRYEWFGDEHGRLYFPQGERPALGEVVELILPHCDPTINLHDSIFLCKGDEVLEEITIDLRGKFF